MHKWHCFLILQLYFYILHQERNLTVIQAQEKKSIEEYNLLLQGKIF